MKATPVLCLAAGLCLLRLSASAASLSAESAITAVTVYADRAIVTRGATVAITAPGVAEIAFDQLPAALVDASLQVSGHGTAGATLLDVAARPVHVPASPHAHAKPLEEELKRIQHELRGLDDRATSVRNQAATLERLEAAATATPTKDSAPRMTIEESAKLMAFLADQRTRLSTEQRTIDEEREQVVARQAAAERQLNELRGPSQRTFKRVIVRVDAAATGEVALQLSYVVPGASWVPSYDARVSADRRSVALGYFGLVRQNTGEDWSGVALTLSTARPSLGGQPPALQPWFMEVWRPVSEERMKKAEMDAFSQRLPARLEKVTAGFGGNGLALEDKHMVAAAAKLEEHATSASFKVPAAASIPSDNAPQRVPITAAEFTAAPEYLTIPKQLPAAFLSAKVTNSSDFPLLAGAMNVFVDGSFIAASGLRTVMPGEKFDLALGADEGIAIKRQINNRFNEDTGILTKGRRVTYDAVITVQNNKRTSERVIVLDQVPLSRDEKIAIKLLAPGEKELKPETDGTLRWTLTLRPGEKRELPVKFTVEHEAGLAVAGLD